MKHTGYNVYYNLLPTLSFIALLGFMKNPAATFFLKSGIMSALKNHHTGLSSMMAFLSLLHKWHGVTLTAWLLT